MKNWTLTLIFIIPLISACQQADTTTPTVLLENTVATKEIRTPPSDWTPEGLPTIEAIGTSLHEQAWAINCPEIRIRWVNDFDVVQIPSVPEPPPREPFLDPIFGTCIVRLTDRSEDISPDDLSTGLKNEYSRVQSFNADGSLVLIYGLDGTWYIYDAVTLKHIRQIPIGVEPRWDSQDPDLVYFIDETRLMAYDVSKDEKSTLRDFSEDFPEQSLAAVWTRFEGSPSLDGRYWGLMAEDQDWLTFAFLVYDLKEDQIISLKYLPKRMEIDSVTISPLGSYFLAYLDDYCKWDQLGNDDMPCGLMVYDQDLENGRGLLRIVGHSDVALDAQGNEVLIYQDIDTDFISMLDLATGKITPLWSIDFTYSPIGFHFSGRGYKLPGWVVMSTYSGAQPPATWMDDQVFAIELKPEGSVVRLAHTHSLVDENQDHDYWAEPHASVNSDFTQVIFTSNWGRSGTGEVETYLIQLPHDWYSNLP
jgi:hypothetical protein